jgi:transcriptional regulator with XRE-family HTH domain
MASKPANGQQETLGELISNRLLELGWSNAELARRTGFSTTYIGNLARDIAPGTKTGKPKRIPDETVERIAKALDVSVDRARAAAGLSKKEYTAPKTVEEALDSAMFFDQKGLSEKDKATLRPYLELLDREVGRLSHPPATPQDDDIRQTYEEFEAEAGGPAVKRIPGDQKADVSINKLRPFKRKTRRDKKKDE